MLLVDLRQLEAGSLETRAEVPADDPLFEGLDAKPVGPLLVEGKLRRTGDDEYFWNGRLRGSVLVACRRCLTEVPAVLDATVRALFSADEAALEDPEAYEIAPSARQIDLAGPVREEVVLNTPQFALCREDCRGLCPQCGADLNTEQCTCAARND